MRHLPLGGRAQLGDLPLHRGPYLRRLVVGHRPQLVRLPLGRRRQLACLPKRRIQLASLPPRRRQDPVGLALRRLAQIIGLAPGGRPQLRGLVLRRGPQLRGARFRRRLQLVRRRAGFLNDLCDLLLGEAEQLLDPRTRPGITRAVPLPQLAGLCFQLPVALIDLMAAIAADHGDRLPGDLTGYGTGLGNSPGIHALSPLNHLAR
jgi:hypothetical protein